MAQIGVQAMMLKDDFEREGPFATLQKVREIGYRAVEVSQIPMTSENVSELARARDELGMTFPALSAALDAAPGLPRDSLSEDFDKIVGDAKTLGATRLRIGMFPVEALRSRDAIFEICDRSEEMATRLAEHGIRLCHHNHHVEFGKLDGEYLLDIVAERAPTLGLEIDVHWVQRGGLDPVRTLRAYEGRVALVHLKDYRIGRIPDAAFEQRAAGNRAAFSAAFAGLVEFAEIGEGNLDIPGIIGASQEIGVEYFFIEQDELYGRTALDCLRTSYENLVDLGFSDLF